jgi:hypothetical protein
VFFLFYETKLAIKIKMKQRERERKTLREEALMSKIYDPI